GAELVRVATGRSVPRTITIAYWYDERRGRLRTVVSRSGVVTRVGSGSGLDPALQTFVTGYRRALAERRVRVLRSGTLGGVPVRWLSLPSLAGGERVAIDSRTY